MTLKIISAEQIEYEGTVTCVTLPGVQGRFQVLRGHAALIAALDEGTLAYDSTDGKRTEQHINGGVADIANDTISVCLY